MLLLLPGRPPREEGDDDGDAGDDGDDGDGDGDGDGVRLGSIESAPLDVSVPGLRSRCPPEAGPGSAGLLEVPLERPGPATLAQWPRGGWRPSISDEPHLRAIIVTLGFSFIPRFVRVRTNGSYHILHHVIWITKQNI